MGEYRKFVPESVVETDGLLFALQGDPPPFFFGAASIEDRRGNIGADNYFTVKAMRERFEYLLRNERDIAIEMSYGRTTHFGQEHRTTTRNVKHDGVVLAQSTEYKSVKKGTFFRPDVTVVMPVSDSHGTLYEVAVTDYADPDFKMTPSAECRYI